MFRWRCDRESNHLVIQFEADMSMLNGGVMWIYLLDEFGVQSPIRINCDPAVRQPVNAWPEVKIMRNTLAQQVGTVRISSLAWDGNRRTQPRHIGLSFRTTERNTSKPDTKSSPPSDGRLRLRNILGSFDPRFMAVLVE